MTIHPCPHCTTGTKGIAIMASTDRISFYFALSLASCDCPLTQAERLQMAAAAIQERLQETPSAPA